jgi:hypothetical protein
LLIPDIGEVIVARVNLLSWNIETYGPKKYVNPNTGVRAPNATAIVNTIAQTADEYDATIISILELSPSVVTDVAVDLCSLLGRTNWRYVVVPTHKRDAYCILYKKNEGFNVLRNNDRTAVTGYTDLDANNRRINFPSVATKAGGRRPGYVAFRTDDRMDDDDNVVFTVICYHAMFGYWTYYGVQNIPDLGPVSTVIDDDDDEYDVGASLISGDFNVDYMTDAAPYGNAAALGITAAPPAVDGNEAKSSLRDGMVPPYPTTTVDYRVNAYDNIFLRFDPALNLTVANTDRGIIDMIQLFLPGNALANRAQTYMKAAIRYGGQITRLPPTTAEDAWLLYRFAVSNHLPVLLRVTL